MIEKLNKCNLTNSLFSVYDYDACSLQDLICQFLQTINSCVDSVNNMNDLLKWIVETGLSEEVAKQLIELCQNGTIADLINNEIFGELNNKINDLRLNVKFFEVDGVGNDTDTTRIKSVLSLIKLNGGGTIYFPEGTYFWNEMVEIPSFTTIESHPKAKHLRNHNGSFLANGNRETDYVEPYSANSDISIIGGIWEGNTDRQSTDYNMFNFGKGKNIKVKNVEFRDYSSHVLDISGCKDVVIDNCKFLGFRFTVGREYAEAIQIAEHTELGFSAIGNWDYSPSKNIEIKNCYFGSSVNKCSSAVYGANGIGGHGATHNIYCENIRIYSNTFENAHNSGVRVFKWNNVVIKDNIFRNCKHGVIVSSVVGGSNSSKDEFGNQTNLCQAGHDVFIENNTFTSCESADIYVSGQTSNINETTSTDKVDRVIIKGNTSYESENFFVRCILTSNTQITNNIIHNFRKGIHNDRCDNVFINDNMLVNGEVDGINCTSGNVLKINSNLISNVKYSGIYCKSSNNFVVSSNQVYQSCLLEENVRSVIDISTSCDTGLIKDNISDVSDYPLYGLNVTETCTNIVEINNRLFGTRNNIGLFNNTSNTSEILLTDNQNIQRKITPNKEILIELLGTTEAYDTDRTPFALLQNKETVILQGFLKNVSVSQDTPIARVGSAYAPKMTKIFTVPISASTSGGYATIGITKSGNIFLYYLSTSATTVSIDGLTWIVGK